MMKVCTKCRIKKLSTEYYKHSNRPCGIASECKTCMSKRKKQEYIKDRLLILKKKQEAYRQPDIYLRHMYNNIVRRCGTIGKYKNRKLEFDYVEFLAWVDNSGFYAAYEEWVRSDFNKKLSPTIDRIDNHNHYTLDNIQILTKAENTRKDSVTKKLTPYKVQQIRDFYSNGSWKQVDLAKAFGVQQTTISQIIRQKSWTHI